MGADGAATYRRVVDAVLAGRSTRAIVAELNAAGIAPRRSKRGRWGHSSIKRLLHDRAAYGSYVVGGIEQQVPPIIDRATWEHVQRLLDGNRTRGGKPGSADALLRKILRCGSCGRTAHVHTATQRDPRTYACAKPSELGDRPPCPDRRHHRVTDVDEAVRARLERLLTDPDVLRAAVGSDRDDEQPRWQTQLSEAESGLARLGEQEARLLRFCDDGLTSETAARQRLAEIQAERRFLEARRVEAADRLDSAEARERISGDLEGLAAELAERVRNAPPDRWRELVAMLFPSAAPYHLSLYPDGRIVGRGRLPLDATRLAAYLVIPDTVSGCSVRNDRSEPARIHAISFDFSTCV